MSRYKVIEPSVSSDNYISDISRAFNWYNQEKDKKDARSYLKDYIALHLTKNDVKNFDRVPDSKIITTYGWISRMIVNNTLTPTDRDFSRFDKYIQDLVDISDQPVDKVIPDEKPTKPSVRDNMKEKITEYLGELEGAMDSFIADGVDFNLYNDLKSRTIPQPYCPFILAWIKKTASTYIEVYETTDAEVKEGYSNIGKRKLTQIIKMLGTWLEDIEKYSQFKKANRKPRIKKTKPAGVLVAKLKYKREDTELGIKSVTPSEIIGASQVWVYNTKSKKLAVYRSDSVAGIQVKGTTLQNYDPDQCEQRTLRKPAETIKEVLAGGKVKLRRILAELTTKESPVNGRINEECIIVRVIK